MVMTLKSISNVGGGWGNFCRVFFSFVVWLLVDSKILVPMVYETLPVGTVMCFCASNDLGSSPMTFNVVQFKENCTF